MLACCSKFKVLGLIKNFKFIKTRVILYVHVNNCFDVRVIMLLLMNVICERNE